MKASLRDIVVQHWREHRYRFIGMWVARGMSRETAEDVVADGYANILVSLSKGGGFNPAKDGEFIGRVLNNAMSAYYQKKKAIKRDPESLDVELLHQPTQDHPILAFNDLTVRLDRSERELMAHLASGKKPEEIARQLGVAEKTVRNRTVLLMGGLTRKWSPQKDALRRTK